MKKLIIIISVVVALFGLLTYKMFSLAKVQCSLCVTFQGMRQCSTAIGATDREAQEEAHRNACSQLTSGVTGAVTCGQTQPEDIVCSPTP